MVDGGNNIVEADWESVSSILQVVGAEFSRLFIYVSNSLSLKPLVLMLLVRLKTNLCAAWPYFYLLNRKENILNVSFN